MERIVNAPKIGEEKRKYLERKKKLIALEEGNLERIIFLRATGGYYIVAGNSAIILANKIAKELKIRVTLKRDTDYDVTFKGGVLSVKNIDFYKRRLAKSVYLKPEKETKDFLYFKLKEKLSEEEFDILKRSKELRRRKLENMIMKSVPMPGLNIKLTDALRLTYKFYRKHSDALSRGFIVGQLAENMRMAHKTMVMVSRGELVVKTGITRIRNYLTAAICDVTQIMELDIWTVEDCTTLSISILEATMQLDRELKAWEKRIEKDKRE